MQGTNDPVTPGRLGRLFGAGASMEGPLAPCGAGLRLKGIDGHYGRQRKVVILSFGAVSRGAIYALKARGFRDITICILRPDHLVREEVLGCHYLRMCASEDFGGGSCDLCRSGIRCSPAQPLAQQPGMEADRTINGV